MVDSLDDPLWLNLVGHSNARCLYSKLFSKQWTDSYSWMELMTISEAARRLGYKSRSQLYRLLNKGYLSEHVHLQQHTGQRLVDIYGLREKLQRICQWRPDRVFLRRNVIEVSDTALIYQARPE